MFVGHGNNRNTQEMNGRTVIEHNGDDSFAANLVYGLVGFLLV